MAIDNQGVSSEQLYFEGATENSSYDAVLEDLAASVDSMFGMKTLYDFLYFPVASGIGPDEVSNEANENRIGKIQTNPQLQNGSISLVFSFGVSGEVEDGDLYDFSEWPAENELSIHERSIITLRAKAAAEQYLDIYPTGFKGAAVAYLNSLLDVLPEETACFCYMGKKYSSEDTIYIPKGEYEFDVSIIPNTYPSDSCSLDKFSALTSIISYSTKYFSNKGGVLWPDKKASKEVEGDIIEASMTYNEEEFYARTRVVVVEIKFNRNLADRNKNTRLIGDWNDESEYASDPWLSRLKTQDIVPNINSYYQYCSDSYGLQYRIKVKVTPQGIDNNIIGIAFDAESGGGRNNVYSRVRQDSLDIPFFDTGAIVPWFTDTLKVGDTNYRLIKRYSQPAISVNLSVVLLTTLVKDSIRGDKYFTPKKTSSKDIRSRIGEVNKLYRRVGVMFNLQQIIKDTVENVAETFEYTPSIRPQLASVVNNSAKIQSAINNTNAVIVIVTKLKNTANALKGSVGGVSFPGLFVSFVLDRTPATGNPVRIYGHELGHSVFNLKHPFDLDEFKSTYAIGDDKFNLMDYSKQGDDDEDEESRKTYPFSQLYFHPYQFRKFVIPTFVPYLERNYQ